MAAAFAAYWLVGFVHNWARTSRSLDDPVRGVVTTAATGLILAAVAFFAWTFLRGRHAVGALGFAIDGRRPIMVTAGAAAYVVVFLVRFPLSIAAFSPVLLLPVAAVLVEEILFRPVLIGLIRTVLARHAHSLEWAILAAAVLWALVHVPSKPPSLVVGIFVTGLVVGALYGYTGSNILGFVFHASANAGSGGAVVMLALCLVVAVAGRWRRLLPLPYGNAGPPPDALSR
jgi:membrane protease YdiL (CAAX protease family)